MSDPKIKPTDPKSCEALYPIDPDAPQSKIKEAEDRRELCKQLRGHKVEETVYIDVKTQNGMVITHVPARITGSIMDPVHPWVVERIRVEIARGAQGTIADDGSILSRKEGEVYTILAGAGTYLAEPRQIEMDLDDMNLFDVSPLQVRQ